VSIQFSDEFVSDETHEFVSDEIGALKLFNLVLMQILIFRSF